jgi:hypothetical protein
VVWDGLDDSGRPAPSGVYFFRAQSDSGTSVSEGALIR